MYRINYSAQMKRNTKLMKKRGKDMAKLAEVLLLLKSGNPLPAKYKDHALKGGKWQGSRECHIEDDWLLTYKVFKDKLILLATGTGTHSDLFG